MKTSADKVILQIFDIFLHEFSLFFKPIEFFGLNKVNWVEKRLKSCEKMSKICKNTLSADVFRTKLDLRKHSTVLNIMLKLSLYLGDSLHFGGACN